MDLYNKYGFYKEKLISIELKGKEGQEKIKEIIEYFRSEDIRSFGDYRVSIKEDYKLSCRTYIENSSREDINLPKSNVIKFIFCNGCYFVVRPSGTEPKMKIYLGVTSENNDSSDKSLLYLEEAVLNSIKEFLPK